MGDTYPTVRVAAAQAAPIWLNREKTLEKAIALIEQAARQDKQPSGNGVAEPIIEVQEVR